MSQKKFLNFPGIYTITCTANGRVYVGQARNIRKRWTSHRWHLARGLHRNAPLQRAWRKYGADAFVFAVVEDLSATSEADLQKVMAEAEIRALQQHAKAFNLMEAGEPVLLASAETREKWSVERKARWADPAYRERVRATQTEKAKDPEFQARRGAAISAGKSTPEYKAKRSRQSLELWSDPDFKAARVAERTANWKDPAYRAQQSESRKAAWANPEIRARRSAALKAAWIRRKAAWKP